MKPSKTVSWLACVVLCCVKGNLFLPYPAASYIKSFLVFSEYYYSLRAFIIFSWFECSDFGIRSLYFFAGPLHCCSVFLLS